MASVGSPKAPSTAGSFVEPEPPAYLILQESGVAGEHWWRWTVQIEPERLVQGGQGQGGGGAWGEHLLHILNVLIRHWCQCWWVNCKSWGGGQLSACSRGGYTVATQGCKLSVSVQVQELSSSRKPSLVHCLLIWKE